MREQKRWFPRVVKSVRNSVRVPREKERDERRIAETGRKRVCCALDQRVRRGDRHSAEKRGDRRCLASPVGHDHSAVTRIAWTPNREPAGPSLRRSVANVCGGRRSARMGSEGWFGSPTSNVAAESPRPCTARMAPQDQAWPHRATATTRSRRLLRPQTVSVRIRSDCNRAIRPGRKQRARNRADSGSLADDPCPRVIEGCINQISGRTRTNG